MTPRAPARDCDHCDRRIGATRSHLVTATEPPLVLCARCLGPDDHARAYPDCTHPWHDMHDHPLAFATRAAVQPVLDALTTTTPAPEDFPCPTCRSAPGMPCVLGRARVGQTSHAGRQDRAIRAQHTRAAIRPW